MLIFFLFFVTYRLDRKSSRGMIYENEELRLRTININAEVERGKFIFFFRYFHILTILNDTVKKKINN